MDILTRLICACLTVVIAGSISAGRFDHHQQTVLGDTTAALRASKQAPAMDETALASSMQAILSANPNLNLSIALTDLQNGKPYLYGETATYTAASISKILTASLYLYQVELRTTTLEQPVAGSPAQSQLEKMIVKSDNAAWHALNAYLTHPALQEYAQMVGLGSYDSQANTVTSTDIALLLTKLASGTLLNNNHTKLLLSYMERADMRNYLVAGVPAGTSVYHKTGYLSDRLHDAAIIKKGDRSFVLVVFSKTGGAYDFPKGALSLQSISRTAAATFFQ